VIAAASGRFLRRLFAAATFGLGFPLACSIYDGTLLLPAPAPGTDAATEKDTGVDASGEAGPTCASAREPNRPSTDDGAEPNLQLTFALSSIQVGVNTPTPATLGIDLDLTCSCPGPQSCVRPVSEPACDDDRGRDSAFTPVLQRFAEFDLERLFNTRLTAGDSGLLIGVARYNGGKNDRAVQVAVYVSHGSESRRVLPEGGSATKPKVDGTDVWTVHPDSLVAGRDAMAAKRTCADTSTACSPVAIDTSAYVADGVLVAHLTSLPTESGIALINPTFDFDHAVLQAKLIQESNVYRLREGALAGRWGTDKVLRSLRSTTNPFTDTGICKSTDLYKTFKTAICASADITSSPTQDNQGAACSAVSASLGFEAIQAQLGLIYERPSAPACPNETDSCAE